MYNIDEIKKKQEINQQYNTKSMQQKNKSTVVQTYKFFSPKAHNKSKRTRRRRGMKIIVVGEGA